MLQPGPHSAFCNALLLALCSTPSGSDSRLPRRRSETNIEASCDTGLLAESKLGYEVLFLHFEENLFTLTKHKWQS